MQPGTWLWSKPRLSLYGPEDVQEASYNLQLLIALCLAVPSPGYRAIGDSHTPGCHRPVVYRAIGDSRALGCPLTGVYRVIGASQCRGGASLYPFQSSYYIKCSGENNRAKSGISDILYCRTFAVRPVCGSMSRTRCSPAIWGAGSVVEIVRGNMLSVCPQEMGGALCVSTNQLEARTVHIKSPLQERGRRRGGAELQGRRLEVLCRTLPAVRVI